MGSLKNDPQEIIRKMYETAEEIQAAWKPRHGDHYCTTPTGTLHWHIGDATFYTKKSEENVLEFFFNRLPVPILKPRYDRLINLEKELPINRFDYIWIPSQAQLQDMIPKIQKYTLSFFYEDDNLCVKIEWGEWDYELYTALTMDLLWLKIVMSLVFKKEWDEGTLVWEKVK